MKKIIIIGHNQKNCEKLESLFHSFGMKQALPSRREGLSPVQIGELLNKVIKLQEQQLGSQENTEVQLLPEKLPTHLRKRQAKKHFKNKSNALASIPKSTWDYIPMDLLIANIDNEFWGWADKNALDHLDYWGKIDPSILFILTYDHPQSLLSELESHESNIDKDVILEKLNDWNRYNTKMLEFLEKNPERVILVSNERIYQKNIMKLVYNQVAPNNVDDTTDIAAASNLANNEKYLSPLFKMVSNQILRLSNEVMDTYRKLQNESRFPCLDEIDNNDNLDSLINIWKENIGHIKIFKEQINTINLENELLLSQLHHIQEEYSSHMDKLSSEKSDLLKEYEKFRADKEKLLQEYENNKQLGEKVKEELENKLNISLSEKSTLLEQKSAIKKEQEEILNYYKNEKANLENAKYEIEKKLKNSLRDNDLLLSQLHLAQEELFKIHLNKTEQKEKLFGAADRFKNELDYRIGSVLVKNSSSIIGWFKMPFSLWQEYSFYKSDKKTKEKLNLPSIEQYEDFYEVEKIKRHLSYKLGCTFLKNIKSPIGWICLPFSIVKEVKIFRKQRNQK